MMIKVWTTKAVKMRFLLPAEKEKVRIQYALLTARIGRMMSIIHPMTMMKDFLIPWMISTKMTRP